MKTNGFVTIYRFDEESERYSKKVFPAHIYMCMKTVPSASELVRSTGAEKDNSAIIRIPGSEVRAIKPGDRLVTGICNLSTPPKDEYLKITAVYDRRTGLNPHMRLECSE